jgi:hypothetical protein
VPPNFEFTSFLLMFYVQQRVPHIVIFNHVRVPTIFLVRYAAACESKKVEKHYSKQQVATHSILKMFNFFDVFFFFFFLKDFFFQTKFHKRYSRHKTWGSEEQNGRHGINLL